MKMTTSPRLRRTRGERVLIGLELFTGLTGVIGGLLLIARPDGSPLSAKLSALAGTPFTDWRIPGVFLATFVGGGALVAAFWHFRRGWHARDLSLVFGLGLLVFEIVEWAWIDFQPLEGLFGLVALIILALAWRLRSGTENGPMPA